MKRIAVTGTTGFLGSRICQYFSGREIITPTHLELEITDQENVNRFFEKNHPDILIHCAAISDVGKCEENVEKSYAINVIGAENLAKLCAKQGTKMIFCSSDQIYFSRKMKHSHKETENVSPCNHYGRQKLEAENRILTVCPEAVCLRLSWMYDKVQILENEHGNFYKTIKERLQRGESCSFPVHDVRGITYVGDVVKNLRKVFLLPGGVYNYGAENSFNTYELVKRLFEKVGVHQGYITPNEQAFADCFRDISMDTSKIRRYGIEFDDTLHKLVHTMLNDND